MQIGVKIGPASDRAELLRSALTCEQAGVHSVWLSERVAVPLDKPHPYKPMVDPWIGLAFVAAVTERVMLGTSVSQIALRPPVLMARELATIDRLSGGRLIVGAGAGWVEEEFTTAGVDFATRGGRLNEFIRLLRHLWANSDKPWNGKHFSVPAVRLIEPLTPGGPPIYCGASGPAGLRRVAKLADGLIAVAVQPDMLANLRSRLAEMRAQFGRSGPFPIWVQVEPPQTLDAAKELVEGYAGAGTDGLILSTPLGERPGFPADESVLPHLIECAARTA